MLNDMKLYDIPRHSRINVQVSDGSSYVIFDHIDGMYSYCKTEKGGLLHLAAGTPLVQDGMHYKIREDV